MSAMHSPSHQQHFAEVAVLFGPLSSMVRVAIAQALCDSERYDGELFVLLGGWQAKVSHDLGTLNRAGLLARRRVGAKLDDPLIPGRIDFLCQTMKHRAPQRPSGD